MNPLLIPAIIADDREKCLAFESGYHFDVDKDAQVEAEFRKVIDIYPDLKANQAVLYCESEIPKLSKRSRAIVNCYKWGRAKRAADTDGRQVATMWMPSSHGFGSSREMDSYEYINRNGKTFFAVAYVQHRDPSDRA